MSKRATTLLRNALEENGLNATKLKKLVSTRRQAGESWMSIALEIHAETGVSTSVQTLINWFPEYNKPAAELVDSS